MSTDIEIVTKAQKMLDLEHACIISPDPVEIATNHCRAMSHKYQWQFEFEAEVASWLHRWPGVTAREIDAHTFELTDSGKHRATVHKHRTWWAVCVSHTKYNGPVRAPEDFFGRSPAVYIDEGHRVLVSVPKRKPLGRMTKWETKTKAKTGDIELPPTFDTSIEAMRRIKQAVVHIERTTAYKFGQNKEGVWGWEAPRIE